MNKDKKRSRSNTNLTALYAVTSEIAYKNGKLRKEVYGAISKDTPFICIPGDKVKNKPRKFKQDLTSSKVPIACKNRILAFWDDKLNKGRSVCYLAEKSLYEEMKNNKR